MMKTKGVLWGASLFLAVMLLFPFGNVAIAEYPEKTIEFLSYSSPGGGTDIFVRTVTQDLEKILKTKIIVGNMPGGSGARAMAYVMGKPSDGYTLLACSTTISASYYRGAMTYSYSDLIPIALGMNEVQTIAVRTESPFKNADDLINAIKSGPALKWAVSNIGGPDHLAAYGIYHSLGKGIQDFKTIPFNSGGEVMVAALSGSVDVIFGNPSELLGQYEARKIRILLVLGDKRSQALPDVPTAKEKGINFSSGSWRAVAVRKGTPDNIVKKLEDSFRRVFQGEVFKKYLKANQMDENWLIGDDFRAFVKNDADFTKRAVIDLGLGKK